jgi:hypothetical protein
MCMHTRDEDDQRHSIWCIPDEMKKHGSWSLHPSFLHMFQWHLFSSEYIVTPRRITSFVRFPQVNSWACTIGHFNTSLNSQVTHGVPIGTIRHATKHSSTWSGTEIPPKHLNTFCFFLWTQNFFVPYSARMRPAFQASPLDEDHLNSDKHLERSEVSIHGKPVRACSSRIITSWSCVTITFFGMFYSCIRKSECAAEPTEKIMQPESHLPNMFSKTAKVGWLWELSWIDHQLKCFAACLSSPQLRVK